MAPLEESVYQELECSFDTLKKLTQHPVTSQLVNEEANDKDKTNIQNQLHDQFRNMLTRIDELINTVTKDPADEDYLKLTSMKASLLYEEAKICLSMEKFAEGKEILINGMAVIKELEVHPFIMYLHMRIVNHLAFASAKLGDFATAKTLLKEITTREVHPNILIYSTEELFKVGMSPSKDSYMKLHSIHINNLQMLSWVYSKMGRESESAMILHKILEKELDFDKCDPVDWAMRTTRVASLYLMRGKFVAARYYLSAAGSALNRVEAALLEHVDLGKAQAELARGWIYYGLRLFDMSKSKDITRLCEKIFEETVSSNTNEEAAEAKTEEPLTEAQQFKNSEVEIANVPASIVTNVTEARTLFHHTQMWLKRARIFYTLRDYPFIYVNCVLDLSELYRFLAFYEPELETQYAVQKRRADALETLSTILKEVRPQCYIAVSVELLRELAEVQIELMGINLKKMYKMHDLHESREVIKQRMEGVYDIQTKLQNISNIIGPSGSDAEVNRANLIGPAH